MKKRYLVISSLVIAILVAVTILQFMADAAAVNELKINIENVRLADIGLISCDVWVTINFTNPTNRDLSIASATFDVFIADNFVGKSSCSQFSILSNSSREQVIFLKVLYSDVARVVFEGITNRNFDIDVSGEAQKYVFYGLFTISVPFSISSTYS